MATDQQRKLIDASNLLCEFVEKNLPPGWEIRLSMCSNEATVSLIDPSGEEVDDDTAGDYGVSTISELCYDASERDAAWIDEADDE